MGEVTINNSPVHTDTVLTGVYGQTGSSWQTCGFHTGTDFAPTGSTPSINAPLYSVCSGTVTYKSTEVVLGNTIVIQDSATGNYWRYCHMNSSSTLSAGDTVTTSTIVGYMGESGTGAHGVHLHLEYATTSSWNCATFLNPSVALNIPNVSGTIVHYDGSTPPIPPTPPSRNKNSNKWRLVYEYEESEDKLMNNKDFQTLTNSMSEKLGKETAAKIADDLGTMISDNSEMNKIIKSKEAEIEKLQKTNEMLTAANGQLLQQVAMGFEEPETKKEEPEEKKPFNFHSVFDEKGNFIK